MDVTTKTIIWDQFGAAIDALENAIVVCPDDLWCDRSKMPEYWYVASHTLLWLDFYLTGSPEGFTPPAPFGLEELDPAGVLPPRVYAKEELLTYLAYGREKCRTKIEGLTEETAQQRFRSGSMNFSIVELLLYSMRHVQHHAAQLNLILRQTINSAPRWTFRSKTRLSGE